MEFIINLSIHPIMSADVLIIQLYAIKNNFSICTNICSVCFTCYFVAQNGSRDLLFLNKAKKVSTKVV